jgi:SAM-dependent methyltransferase
VTEGLDPTGRFSNRAADYARHRPTYPAGAIDAVLEGLGRASGLVAADVGAGTGISATLLAERGVRVTAVEPNRAMREAAAPHPLVEWREGTAEATGLPGASVDLVLCAQSFHWFRPEAASSEFHRILVPRGRLALVWNERDPRDETTARYGRVVEDAGRDEVRRMRSIEVESPLPGFTPPREVVVEGHVQSLDADGLLGRAMSASYVPTSGAAHDAVVRDLRALHAEHAGADGRVRLVYRTRVFLFERAVDRI